MFSFDLRTRLGRITDSPDIVIEFRDTDLDTCWLASTAGTVSVGDGHHPEPQLLVRAVGMPLAEALGNTCVGWRAAQSLEFSVPGGPWGPMPPFDVGPQPQGTEVIEGLDVVVQHIKTNSPVGTIEYLDRFVDGRLTDRVGGTTVEEADAVISNTFERMIAGFDPLRPLLEAAAGFQVAARDVSLLMVIGGLYDSPDIRHHFNQRPEVNALLCRLAAITQSGTWLASMGAAS